MSFPKYVKSQKALLTSIERRWNVQEDVRTVTPDVRRHYCDIVLLFRIQAQIQEIVVRIRLLEITIHSKIDMILTV